ncbi:MAG: tetratricopeptide repeat protein [Myxococcales bacterium]|nr:tetratricopeptide repeat protein [Myxococcales bacterium]
MVTKTNHAASAIQAGIDAYRRGELSSAQQSFLLAAQLARHDNSTVTERQALEYAGTVAYRRKQLDIALQCYQTACELATADGAVENAAVATSQIGLILADMGRTNEALEYQLEALAAHRRAANQQGIGASAGNIGLLMISIGKNDEGRAYLEEALSSYMNADDAPGVAMSLYYLGDVARKVGDIHLAMGYLEHAAGIYSDLNDPAGHARVVLLIGNIERNQGNNERAQSLFERALDQYRAVGDDEGCAAAETNLGLVLCATGNVVDARECFRRVEEVHRRLGSEVGLAGDFVNLATADQALGDLASAEAYLSAAHASYLRLGQDGHVALTMSQLGQVFAHQGKVHEAESLFHNALNSSEKLKSEYRAVLTANLAAVELYWGNLVQARTQIFRALLMFREAPDPTGLATCLQLATEILIYLGDLDDAHDLITESIELSNKIGRIEATLESQRLEALLAAEWGDWQAAETLLVRLLERTQENELLMVSSGLIVDLGNVRLLAEKYADAKTCFEVGLAAFSKFKAPRGIASAQSGLGASLAALGWHAEGLELLQRARNKHTQLGARLSTALCDERLGDLYRRCGDNERAKSRYEQAITAYQQCGSRLRSQRLVRFVP